MIPLSAAIRKGALLCEGEGTPYFGANCGCDAFGAAHLGALREPEIEPFWQFRKTASDESFKEHMVRSLMRVFPQLGSTVRSWPALAAELESLSLLPRRARNRTAYRREEHMSLWQTIVCLQYEGSRKAEIADFLARHGL